MGQKSTERSTTDERTSTIVMNRDRNNLEKWVKIDN